MMKILIIFFMIILIVGCKNGKTYSFVISVYHEEKHLHEDVLSYFESFNYINKEISGVKTPKILEASNDEGKLLEQSSVYESSTANVGLLSIYPNTRLIFTFMLKNQTYKYSTVEKEFLNGYCQLIKKYIKQGTKLEFIDYKPTKDMPACFELLETGKAVYKNVNS